MEGVRFPRSSARMKDIRARFERVGASFEQFEPGSFQIISTEYLYPRKKGRDFRAIGAIGADSSGGGTQLLVRV